MYRLQTDKQRIELGLLDSQAGQVIANLLGREYEIILRLQRYVTYPQAREAIAMGVPFFAMHDVVRPSDAFADCVGIAGV